MRTPPPTFDVELVAAIEDHLELDYWTEPIYSDTRNKGTYWEVKTVLYRGRENKSYPRPMFDTIDVDTFSGQTSGHTVVRGCSCYDFARTNLCEDHPELPWSDELRMCVRPGTRADTPIMAPVARDRQLLFERAERRRWENHPLFSGPRGDYTIPANIIEVNSETGQFFSIETEGPSDPF